MPRPYTPQHVTSTVERSTIRNAVNWVHRIARERARDATCPRAARRPRRERLGGDSRARAEVEPHLGVMWARRVSLMSRPPHGLGALKACVKRWISVE